jgi:glyoxalase-like protein
MAVRCRLDHISVTAPDLARGAAYVSQLLGVDLDGGGEHALFATHNRLLRLGDAVYLEVIAPNPAMPRPARRRWFALDEQTPATLPRLAAWIASCDDLRAAAAGASEPLGAIEQLTRDGMRWEMIVPRDGDLALGGAAPLVIQWGTGGRTVTRLTDRGCRLRRLELRHPEAPRVEALLHSIGFADELVAVTALPAGAPPQLIAEIDTPSGPRQLGA